MLVTFCNVTVSIEAENPRAAYDSLCETLHSAGKPLEFTTDTFSTEDNPEEHDTEELFPE
jgi:hypothetical protein